MEIKILFDATVKQEIIHRINQLSPESKAQWGKMNAAQMLAHVQLPIKIAYGAHQPKGSFLLKLIGHCLNQNSGTTNLTSKAFLPIPHL
jgi:hypothetical protein